jgi:hypothetical protein
MADATIGGFIRSFGHRNLTLMSRPLTVPFAALALFLEPSWQRVTFGIP